MVTVNGRTIPVYESRLDSAQIPFNVMTDINTADKSGTTMVNTKGMSYVRFGHHVQYHGKVYNDPNAQHEYYAFAIGDLTPVAQMPTTGKAHYQGNGSYYRGEHPTSLPWGQQSDQADFYVDFGNKTIDGVVGLRGIPLSGTIEGNSFSGTKIDNSPQFNRKSDVFMTGHFYGPNANELGGVFRGTYNGDKVMGSFGARQIKN
ncbi:transferrin-binding protein-like solute binding protein [Kingella oralis]|jgi:hypothetical protein|uniref:Transferrin-binding protein B C-lobe/N-lobe beta-barrel domain-containing protein n=1 Tax=Kingella oralis ATCC 51147 TaxID=629741 RepID=C4GMU9_9NEIS|nr:transferrin-binding protein-like solute binding protein [Kingella oralis]EEP66634.1 hypothetical protein GCWU000324_03035 [Kingella oralis ATCC 51147]QMT42479.1 transferrin-binding protein-like solute binding protein [Kingella oralis]